MNWIVRALSQPNKTKQNKKIMMNFKKMTAAEPTVLAFGKLFLSHINNSNNNISMIGKSV